MPMTVRPRVLSTANRVSACVGSATTRWAPTFIRAPVLPHSLHISPLPRISTMSDKCQQPQGQDGALSALNVAIDGLNLAKEVVSITPAKAVIGSVAILLAMIRVSLLLLYGNIFQVHTSSGHDGQRSGLRRSRDVLCRYLQSPQARNGGKEIGRSQRIGTRRYKSANNVSSVYVKCPLFPRSSFSRTPGSLGKFMRRSLNGTSAIGSPGPLTRGMTRT